MHEARALVKFDLPSTLVGATVKSAELSVHKKTYKEAKKLAYLSMPNEYNTNGGMSLHRVDTVWTLDDVVNAQTAYANIVGDLSKTGDISLFKDSLIDSVEYSAASTEWLTFNVTAAVAEMIADPRTNNGFIVVTHSPRCDALLTNTSVYGAGIWSWWESSEASNQELRPKLTINFASDGVGLKETTAASPLLMSHIKRGALIIDTKISGQATIELFDMSGKTVFSTNEYLNPGTTGVALPTGLGVGARLLRLTTPSVSFTTKVLLSMP